MSDLIQRGPALASQTLLSQPEQLSDWAASSEAAKESDLCLTRQSASATAQPSRSTRSGLFVSCPNGASVS
jgi:hypothetical protein